MRAVVQRVLSASVSIGGEVTASIEKGLMVLIGVEVGDTGSPTGPCWKRAAASWP